MDCIFLNRCDAFFLVYSDGNNHPDDFAFMNWKYIIAATVLVYFLRGDEWFLYFAAYADYCYEFQGINKTTEDLGNFFSCFSKAATFQ